jgi:hypothetical protein
MEVAQEVLYEFVDSEVWNEGDSNVADILL